MSDGWCAAKAFSASTTRGWQCLGESNHKGEHNFGGAPSDAVLQADTRLDDPFSLHRDHLWTTADGWWYCEQCHVHLQPPRDRDWVYSMEHLYGAVLQLIEHAQGKPAPDLAWAAKYAADYLERLHR